MMLKGVQKLTFNTQAARTYFVNLGKSLNLSGFSFFTWEIKNNAIVFLTTSCEL